MKEPWQEQLKWCKERYIPFMQFCGYEVDETDVKKFEESFDLTLHYCDTVPMGGLSKFYAWKGTGIPFCHGALLYALSHKVPQIEIPSIRSDWPAKVYKLQINPLISYYTYQELLLELDKNEVRPVGTKGIVKSEDKYGDGFTERYEGILTRYLWWSRIPSFEVAPVVGQKDFHRLTYLYFVIDDSTSKQNQFLDVKFVAKGE